MVIICSVFRRQQRKCSFAMAVTAPAAFNNTIDNSHYYQLQNKRALQQKRGTMDRVAAAHVFKRYHETPHNRCWGEVGDGGTIIEY